jgi:flavin-dependent dehydrogenase
MKFDYDVVIIGGAFSGAATALTRRNGSAIASRFERCCVPVKYNLAEKHPG